CVEPGFLFEVVDDVVEVPDVQSIAAAWLLEELLGRRYGGSSGTNFVACLQLAGRLRTWGKRGAIVTLLCDRGERYEETLFDRTWLEGRGLNPKPELARLRASITARRSGRASGLAEHQAAVGAAEAEAVGHHRGQ